MFKSMMLLLAAAGLIGSADITSAQTVLDRPVVVMDGGLQFQITALEIRKTGDERYEIITRLQGRTSGTSYTRRDIDCRRFMARNLQDADTLEAVRLPRVNNAFEWNRLSEGSAQWRAARLVCHGQPN